jgi:hypothetical protein
VVDVARRIDPHQARTASCRLRHRRSLRRRRRGLRRRSRHRTRSWSCHLRRWRSWRCHRTWCNYRGRRCRSLCRSWSFRRIPLLHALVSPAGPLFAGGRRISSILALSGRSRRCLSHRNLRRQKSRRNRHQTNRYLHKRSR